MSATRCPHAREARGGSEIPARRLYCGAGESVLTGSRYGSLALFNLRASILTRSRAVGAAGNRARKARCKINCVTGRNPLPSISELAKRLLSHRQRHVISAAVRSRSLTMAIYCDAPRPVRRHRFFCFLPRTRFSFRRLAIRACTKRP